MFFPNIFFFVFFFSLSVYLCVSQQTLHTEQMEFVVDLSRSRFRFEFYVRHNSNATAHTLTFQKSNVEKNIFKRGENREEKKHYNNSSRNNNKFNNSHRQRERENKKKSPTTAKKNTTNENKRTAYETIERSQLFICTCCCHIGYAAVSLSFIQFNAHGSIQIELA